MKRIVNDYPIKTNNMREYKKTRRKMDHWLNIKKFLRAIMIFNFS